MKGYLKMLASDFEAWNTQVLLDYLQETGDTTCTQYTFSTPDTDPDYVWVRVEHDFIEGDIKTKEEAIAAGMVVPTGEM